MLSLRGSLLGPPASAGHRRRERDEGGKFWIWLPNPVSRRTWEVKMDKLYLKMLPWCFACFLNCYLTVTEWNYSKTQLWTSSQSECRIEYAAHFFKRLEENWADYIAFILLFSIMFFNWDSLLFLKKIRSKVQVLRGDIIIISFCHSEGNFWSCG